MKYYQYCNNVKNILVPTVHQPCECTPYVQESKKLRVLKINKDKRKALARKNGNENPIWSWNDSATEQKMPPAEPLFVYVGIFTPYSDRTRISRYDDPTTSIASSHPHIPPTLPTTDESLKALLLFMPIYRQHHRIYPAYKGA